MSTFDAKTHVENAWSKRSDIALQFTELVEMVQAAYAAGQRAGAEDERRYMQQRIEQRARVLMLEHYDADLYKRALEDHLKACNRPIVIPASTQPSPPERKP